MLKITFFSIIFFVTIVLIISPADAQPEPATYKTTSYPLLTDTYTSYYTPNTNYGTSTSLDVYANNNNPFIKFDNSANTTIASAVLHIYVTGAPSGGGMIHLLNTSSSTWSETGLTYKNKPSTVSYYSDNVHVYNGWNSITLNSNALTPKIHSLMIEDVIATSFSIASSESAYAPYVTVNATGTNPVSVDFFGSPITGTIPFTTYFYDSSTGGATSWLWDFGDGYRSTEQNPIHVYGHSGNFSVSLTATRDNDGSTDTITKTNYISIPSDYISNNYTNNDSRAFLVTAGQNINFNITPSDSASISSYDWEVNHTSISNNYNNYTFTVPVGIDNYPPSRIWEIRVTATYTNGTKIYREWLISSLPISEAPDFIEYFTAQNNLNGYQWFTDPWGRSTSRYTGETTNKAATGMLTSSSAVLTSVDDLGGTYSTAIFKLKNDHGTSGTTQFGVGIADKYSMEVDAGTTTTHDYLSLKDSTVLGGNYFPIAKRWIEQAPGGQNWRDPLWHTVKVVWTPDGWVYFYKDDELYPCTVGYWSHKTTNGYIELWSGEALQLDNVQIYRDKCYFPIQNISYGTYPKYWYNSSSTLHLAVNGTGITAVGQNITLKQISDSIANSSIISYDEGTKTATINTDLFLSASSNLNIINETIIFNTSSASRIIRPDAGAYINITNSTITTSANNPVIWGFVSVQAQTIHGAQAYLYNRADPRYSGDPRHQPWMNWNGRLIIQNSTINNTCNIFLQGAKEIKIDNVAFSNMSNGDYGATGDSVTHGYLPHMTGSKALWIVPCMDMANFSVTNISFPNPKEALTVEVPGGQFVQNDTTIENSDLSNINILSKKSMKQQWFKTFNLPDEYSHISILNCKYNESNFSVPSDKAKIETKYYAKINVTDILGNPIQNAQITITASDTNYSSENTYKVLSPTQTLPNDGTVPQGVTTYGWYATHPADTTYGEYVGPGSGGTNDYTPSYIDANGTLQPVTLGATPDLRYIACRGGWFLKWFNARPSTKFTTDSNGKTGNPSENSTNTIVLTDKVFTKENGVQSNRSIRYSLNINAPNSKALYIQNVSPDLTWYRENPLSSTYTITAIIPKNSSVTNIIGFAPSADDQLDQGENKNFRVWTDGNLTEMKWYVDNTTNNTTVAEGVFNYTCNLSQNIRKITFSGKDSNGTAVNHVWELEDKNSSNLYCDVNNDGIVNIYDINLIMLHYGENYYNSFPSWDINKDGSINIKDLYLVQKYFGTENN